VGDGRDGCGALVGVLGGRPTDAAAGVELTQQALGVFLAELSPSFSLPGVSLGGNNRFLPLHQRPQYLPD
jgi:hypothetical protein